MTNMYRYTDRWTTEYHIRIPMKVYMCRGRESLKQTICNQKMFTQLRRCFQNVLWCNKLNSMYFAWKSKIFSTQYFLILACGQALPAWSSGFTNLARTVDLSGIKSSLFILITYFIISLQWLQREGVTNLRSSTECKLCIIRVTRSRRSWS